MFRDFIITYRNIRNKLETRCPKIANLSASVLFIWTRGLLQFNQPKKQCARCRTALATHIAPRTTYVSVFRHVYPLNE